MLNNNDQIYESELNPGEQILWSGQPQQGRLLRPFDKFGNILSNICLVGTVFWAIFALNAGWSIKEVILVFPMSLYLLYMRYFRYDIDSWGRSKQFYAVTDQKIIFIFGLFRRQSKIIYLKDLTEVHLSVLSNGRGSIFFGPIEPLLGQRFFDNHTIPREYRFSPPLSFDHIEKARDVFQLIQQAQSELEPHNDRFVLFSVKRAKQLP